MYYAIMDAVRNIFHVNSRQIPLNWQDYRQCNLKDFYICQGHRHSHRIRGHCYSKCAWKAQVFSHLAMDSSIPLGGISESRKAYGNQKKCILTRPLCTHKFEKHFFWSRIVWNVNFGCGLPGINRAVQQLRAIRGGQVGLSSLACCLFLNGLHPKNGFYIVEKFF